MASVARRPAPMQIQEPATEPTTHDATDLVPLQSVESTPHIPPDGGYGWVCALSVFLINANTWGVNSSWAVILAHYSANSTYPGATHLEYSLIGGLSISQALVITPLIARAYRHLGLRATLFIGAVLQFPGLFLSSYATQIWHLFLTQGACFGWGMGFLYITASTTLPPWFSTQRSLAVGLSAAGSGIGGIAYSLVTNLAIEKLGVPWTYRILALCSLVANLVALVLLREVHQGRGEAQSAGTRQNLHFRLHDFIKVEVLLVVLWGVATELGYITLLYSVPGFATSIGLTATQGSVANAMLNLGLGIGRPPLGYFSDRFGRINAACFVTALCGIWCFALWIPTQGFALLCVFALLAGSMCGTFWSTVTPILAEVAGISRMGRVFGAICLCMVLPTTFAEPVAMQIVDSHGGPTQIFLAAQIFVGCMFITGALSLFLLRAWRIARLETEGEPETGMSVSRAISRLATSGSGRCMVWFAFKSLLKIKKV